MVFFVLSLNLFAQSLEFQVPEKSSKKNTHPPKINKDFNQEAVAEVQKSKKNQKRSFRGSFGLQGNQLGEKTGEETGNRYMGDLDLFYLSEDEEGDKKVFDFASRVNDASLVMFSVKEAYVGKEASKEFSDEENSIGYKLGRVILDWSKLDEKWGFGKLNNRVNFDFFRPGQEGLTGLLIEFRHKTGLFAKGFASYVYVPELNPSLDIDVNAGTVKSRHPWAKAPPATNESAGKERALYYDVQYPDIQDIVFNYSVGGSVGFENKHFLAEGFYMRKPDNRIGVAADFKVDPVGFDKVDITVEPGIFYQDVFGGQLKYENRGFEIYASYLYSKPDADFNGDTSFYEATSYKHIRIEEEYGGVGMARAFNDSYRMELNYVARRSRYEKINDNPLNEEPRWNEAINVNFIARWSPRFSSLLDIKYDIFSLDRLFSFATTYAYSKDVDLVAGFDVIGANDAGENETFWSPFRNNDAVYGRMVYRF